MDQVKVYLKLAVKYRFWIAVSIALLLPVIGYVIGSGEMNTVTAAEEKKIKDAKTEIAKFTTPGLVNFQYQPLAATKKEALVQEVDATWRKLFATQEPLLKWPAAVEERFRKWGRKFPDVDRNQVQTTLIDYTVAYPEFVEKIYKVVNPFNFDDGSGIVVAPEAKVLLSPAEFKQDSPPDLTKVWSEQERLWVVTALLDAIAKVNESVAAKDWDGAIVKQINALEVGASRDQDQKSIAKNEVLAPPDPIVDPLNPNAAAAAPPPGGKPGEGAPAMGGEGKTNEIVYFKTDSQQYKALPIRLTVLVDQAKLPNFLVGLENSPMSIEVNEVEIGKPLTPVAKPAYGERAAFNLGSMMGMGGKGEDGMGSIGRSMGGMGGRPGAGGMASPMAGGGGPGMSPMGGRGGMSPGAGAGKATGGVDKRSEDARKTRADKVKKENEAAKNKGEAKKIDQYYNVIEVTVYGRARFYLAPPPAPQPAPSTAEVSPTPAPVATTPATPPAQPAAPPDAAKKDEAPKAEAKKDEAPKAEAKKDEEPKAEAKKDEAPKAEAPKPEAPKGDSPAPKP